MYLNLWSYKVVRHWNSNPMIQPEPEGSTQGYPLDSVEVLRFYTLAGNPIKEILLKLNLPDHRILNDEGEVERESETKMSKNNVHDYPVKCFKGRIGYLQVRTPKVEKRPLGNAGKANVVVIKEKLQAARDRQKSYADSGRKMTEYEVGENDCFKVSPWKGVMRFGKKGKLAPRYVGPFEILERIGPVAYRLRLPEELIGVHDTFHVSNLKKCLGNANLHVSLNEIKIDKTLCFVEEPVEIMDREVKSLKRSRIQL
ncbi:hypothetical protein Tco_0657588 [Tanacetum coccineum]